jgi:hypothetical protein
MKRFRFSFFTKKAGARPVSQAYKYHFIHIPKNGGTSVRTALAQRGDVSLGNPFHSRYVDVVPDLGKELRYFCVVRNPWSRTASRYVFAKQNALRWPRNDPRKRYIEKASFEDYVREQRIFEIPEHPGKPWMGPMNSWFNQLEWIADENQIVRCDCLRLERLENDLETYFGESIKLTRENTSKDRYNYRDMYSHHLIELVGETFQRDIDYFGFTFEGSATKNIVGEPDLSRVT